jgi:isopentenyl diphosphate isomerase/L-lactate dehydrogenase-like FMN-dependent dehydrogenase
MMKHDRRRFLSWLAASPLAHSLTAAEPSPIAKPEHALNVFDFESAMKAKVSAAHYAYMATGVDDGKTLRANRDAFDRWYLRPRRFVDVSQTNTTLELFGQDLKIPILIAPTGSQKAYHPSGEEAVARAAAAKGFQMVLSTVTSTPIETIAQLHREPLWYQLYPTNRWEATERMLLRAEAAGCPVVFLTVDTQGGRNTETELREQADTRACNACHVPQEGVPRFLWRKKPMFEGLDFRGLSTHNTAQTWDVIARLRNATRMKLVIKGLETSEDAARAADLGVDGIVVSNHGARAVESGRGTLDCLPEVLQAVKGRVPVLIDGGFRRGTDVYKALALGARAILIGRPYLWGLGAFGEPGVAMVLDIFRKELELAMRQCGTPNLAAITPSHIGKHA